MLCSLVLAPNPKAILPGIPSLDCAILCTDISSLNMFLFLT